jgi:hypothetical protein
MLMSRKVKFTILSVVFIMVAVGCGGGGGSSDTPVVTPPPPSSKPATTSGSIAIMGLGDTILVTNQETVTVSGVAESNIGIKQIEFINETTGINGTANGTDNWTAQIPLNEGDNKLSFTAIFKDNSQTKITTTLTYYPGLKFTSGLTLSQKVLYIGEAQDITFKIGIDINDTKKAALYETDENGKVLSQKTVLLDDGTLPDEIQKDGVFTAKVNLNSNNKGKLCYRVGVLTGTTVDYYSETECALVTEHYSNDVISVAIKLADDTKAAYEQAIASGKSMSEAMQLAADKLKGNPEIGTYGYEEGSGIWWISKDGILGGFHPTLSGQKTGNSIKTRVASQPVINTASERVLTYYPSSYLNTRLTKTINTSSQPNLSLTDDVKNFIHSNKGLIISPYINNPEDGPNFGNNDDYYGPWEVIKNKKSCQLYAAKEVINNGDVNVSLPTFILNNNYGYIHISTHGENFYNGLFSLWEDEWGDKTALGGALSQVVLYTGIRLPKNDDGSFNLTGYENLLKLKYIAVYPDGAIAFLPAFIRDFGQTFPNSIVMLSACRSMYNNSLANAYISKGAAAVVGFTDYVASSYAKNTTTTIIEELLNGKTLKEAIDEAITKYGSNDGDKDHPAYLVMTGNSNITLSGKIQNAGFETGNLTPWNKIGDGRIISQLGITSPTEGSYMGIISTGLGYTKLAGSLQQDFCVSENANQLSFEWNFFSEEFKEFCGSKYQDTFNVKICELDLENNATEKECKTLLNKNIDSLCSSVGRSDIVFDLPADENGSGVYDTGWQNYYQDISDYAGKAVRLKFSATDVGDSIYDTAILIDQIEISELAE